MCNNCYFKKKKKSKERQQDRGKGSKINPTKQEMTGRQLKPKKTSDQVALVSHDITIELKTLKKLNMLERKKITNFNSN